jgi:hypothetical protein
MEDGSRLERKDDSILFENIGLELDGSRLWMNYYSFVS